MTARGKFVAIEGIDGAGKSRIMNDLKWHIRHDTFLTREPYLGHIIQQLKYVENPATKALLFAADRAVHLEQIISPAINNGHSVISDRYIASNFAYQIFEMGDGAFDWLLSIQPKPLIMPDLIIHFVVDPWEASRRCAAKGEHEDPDRLAHIDENYTHFYDNLISKFPGITPRVVKVDTSLPYEEVLWMVLDLIKDLKPALIRPGVAEA